MSVALAFGIYVGAIVGGILGAQIQKLVEQHRRTNRLYAAQAQIDNTRKEVSA